MGFACTCKRGLVLASAIFVIISGAIVAYASFYLAFSSVGENTGNKKIFMWTGVIEAGVILIIFILGLVAVCTDKPNKPALSIVSNLSSLSSCSASLSLDLSLHSCSSSEANHPIGMM